MARTFLAPRSFEMKLKTLVLGLCLVACGGAVVSTPRIRVARDFGCPVEQTSFEKVEQTQPDYAKWRLDGCGKSAVYLCTMPVRDCWREGDPGRTSVTPVPTPN